MPNIANTLYIMANIEDTCVGNGFFLYVILLFSFVFLQ